MASRSSTLEDVSLHDDRLALADQSDAGIASSFDSDVATSETRDATAIKPHVTSSLDPEAAQQSGMLASISNLANSIIGAGVLSVPYLFKANGAIPTLLLLFFGAVLSGVSLQMLVYVGACTGVMSYEEIAHVLFGKVGRFSVVFSMLIINLGATIAYLYVMADVLTVDFEPLAMTSDFGAVVLSRQGMMIMLSLFVLLPLALLRRMNALRFASFLSMGILVLLLASLIAESIRASSDSTEYDAYRSGKFNWSDSTPQSLFISLPIISFAYTCHSNLYPIQYELKKTTRKRMGIVIFWSLIICMVVYSVVGFCAYYLYHDETGEDILVNMGESGQTIFTVVRLTYVVSLATTYPFSTFPMRTAIDELFFQGKPFSNLRATVESSIIVLVVLLIALVVPTLTIVFSFAGAIASTSVCYLLPPLMVLKTHGGIPFWPSGAIVEKEVDSSSRPSPLPTIGTPVADDEQPLASEWVLSIRGYTFPLYRKGDWKVARVSSLIVFPIGVVVFIVSNTVLAIYGDGS